MLHSNEDKKQLIQSMKKLTIHVANNPVRQRQIFGSLAKHDLLKIVANLNDDNEYLRRISALLLCELLYNNPELKEKAVGLLEVFPRAGRICLNHIPQAIHRYPSTVKRCVQLMQSPILQGEADKMCWVINLDRKTLKIELLEYKKYSSFTFLDPSRNIFGVTTDNPLSTRTVQINSARLYTPKQSQRDRSTDSQKSNDRDRGTGVGSTSFYRNYIQARNRSKEAKQKTQQTSQIKKNESLLIGERKELGSYVRPMTTRLNASGNYSYLRESDRKQDFNSSADKGKMNTIQSISQYARSSYSKNYARPRLSETGRTPELPRQSLYIEPMTERKDQSRDRFESQQDSERLPEWQKGTHQNFYKRVKQILKK